MAVGIGTQGNRSEIDSRDARMSRSEYSDSASCADSGVKKGSCESNASCVEGAECSICEWLSFARVRMKCAPSSGRVIMRGITE